MDKKWLILGDIHGKSIWKDIIDKESPDLVIFLGDYVTTHYTVENISEENQYNNLVNLLDYKEENPDKVILIRGNHDLDTLGYYWAECSGHNQKLHKLLKNLKNRFLKLTQWVYINQINETTVLFSHAGVSNTWFDSVKKLTGISDIKDINTLEPSELFSFTPDSPFDMCGESSTQPCIWIRPISLMEDMPKDIIQVVGHTPVKESCVNLTEEVRIKTNQKLESVPDLWLCDALDNKSYVVFENGHLQSRYL